jgi:hypothetical protein
MASYWSNEFGVDAIVESQRRVPGAHGLRLHCHYNNIATLVRQSSNSVYLIYLVICNCDQDLK